MPRSVCPPLDGSAAGARRTDLDLLRILICAAVILAHALLIFAAEPRYHLKSAEPSAGASVLYEWMRVTTMPAFFTLAGWAGVVSLRRRDLARFVRERGERLLLPMAAGVLLLGPVLKFIELSQGRDLRLDGLRLVPPPQLDFLTFLPLYWRRMNLLTWSHLWFLAYLFLFSLLLLPLLKWLSAREPSAAGPHPAWAYAPALPLVLVLVAGRGYWPFYPSLCHDWANFTYFGLCFAFGGVLAAWPGLEARLAGEAPRLLLLALAAFAGVVLRGESAVGRLLVALTAWGATAAALGYAGRYRPAPTGLFSYLSEATLPVYIVHHPVELLLGLAIVPLALPVAARVVLIWLLATAASLACYHWLIRPWRLMRYLTGMHATANNLGLTGAGGGTSPGRRSWPAPPSRTTASPGSGRCCPR